MAKAKGPRIFITLECAFCRQNLEKRSPGLSRYLTSKNRRNSPEKLELSKYCPYCNQHTIHKEIK
ncbi:MAG: 50S ribosomal protein L33 [Pedobacter sp.]|nr:MAG: 50S ribosomal protein L33 [Pedobacter sp.]